MSKPFDPADHLDFDHLNEFSLDLQVTLGRTGEYDLLRYFSVSINSDIVDPDGAVTCIGSMTGWYSRSVAEGNLTDAGDAIDGEAYELAWGAAAIIEEVTDEYYDEVLLINRITLDEEWRGHKLMRYLVENTVDLLQGEPSWVIAVLYPEPISLDGSGEPLDDGPERDAGMAKLHAACRAGGFQPWGNGTVWWRDFVPVPVGAG